MPADDFRRFGAPEHQGEMQGLHPLSVVGVQVRARLDEQFGYIGVPCLPENMAKTTANNVITPRLW